MLSLGVWYNGTKDTDDQKAFLRGAINAIAFMSIADLDISVEDTEEINAHAGTLCKQLY